MKSFKVLKNTLLVSTAVLIGLGAYGVNRVGNDDGLVEGPRSHKQAKHTEAKHEHSMRDKASSSNGGAKSSDTTVVTDSTDSATATYDTQVDTVPYEPVAEPSTADTAVTSISNESVTTQQQVTNEANAEAYQEGGSIRDSPYLIDGVPVTQDEAHAYAESIMQQQNDAIASSQAEQASIDNNMKTYKEAHPEQFGTGE